DLSHAADLACGTSRAHALRLCHFANAQVSDGSPFLGWHRACSVRQVAAHRVQDTKRTAPVENVSCAPRLLEGGLLASKEVGSDEDRTDSRAPSLSAIGSATGSPDHRTAGPRDRVRPAR